MFILNILKINLKSHLVLLILITTYKNKNKKGFYPVMVHISQKHYFIISFQHILFVLPKKKKKNSSDGFNHCPPI